MDTTQGLLIAIAWSLLRFGLPVILTVFVCWLFRRIDERWKAEAKSYREKTGIETLMPTIRCWVLNDCPEEKREKCMAYQEQHIPCWQHFRSMNGELKETCIGCGVFRGVPIPVTGD
jgi:hypothetical protein